MIIIAILTKGEKRSILKEYKKYTSLKRK